MTKTLLILAAMPEEMDFLTHQFPNGVQQTESHLTFYQADFQGLKIVTAVSGIGKVNAAIAATLGIQKFQPTMVVNIGASGALSPAISIGDVVIASMLQHHDANATQFGYAIGQLPRMPVYYAADTKLLKAFESKESALNFKLFSGLVCSGDSFVSDESFGIEIKQKFPEILALDMESCGIAQTCHQLGVEFCCIRGITDSAGKGADKSYKECLDIAMIHANTVLLKLLEISQ